MRVMPDKAANQLTLADLSVLVIDDDEDLLDYVEALLQDMGVKRVAKASGGSDALRQFDQDEEDHPFNLIICDWMMPEKSGLDVLRDIRERDPDAQFIMLTSKTENQDIAEAVELGTDMYIKKPVKPDSFKDKIKYFLLTRNQAQD